jgi:hypothetical protein
MANLRSPHLKKPSKINAAYCHCERSEATQEQMRLSTQLLGCFAALAMTKNARLNFGHIQYGVILGLGHVIN